MRVLKFIAFALGGAAAVLVAGALFILATFDANRFKGDITDIVLEKKQRTLRIEGDLRLAFWPSLGVKLGRTTLSERASEKEFAALDSAQLSLAILPLLRKQVVVDEVRFAGVRATVVRGKDGKLNIDDLLAPDEQKGETIRFDVAGIVIADSRLAFRDEAAARTIQVSDLKLATGRLGNAAEGKLALETRLAIDQPPVAAALSLVGNYRYDLDQKQYAVAGLDARLAGDAAGVQGLDLRIAAARLQLKPQTGEVEVEKLALAAKGSRAEERFDLQAEAPMLVLAGEKALGQSVVAALKLAGPQRAVAAKLNLAGVEGTSRALRITNVKLDLDFEQAGTALRGSLSAPLAADTAAQTVELAKLTGSVDVSNPRMPMKSLKLPIAGSLRADLARSAASGELSTKFDESSIRAKWSLASFAPPALGFDVDIDRLNLDRYLPPQAPATQKAPEQPFDFSALKGINANGAVKIGALQVAKVKASNIRLDLRAKDGRLEVNPIAASLYQGSLSGSLAVNANNNQVAINQSLANVAINPLMKDVADKDLIEGRGNVVLNLTTGGTTPSAMKRALNGSARVALRDGAVKGINLAKSVREVRARVGPGRQAAQAASQTEKTDFSELSASFRIANGVARNDDLIAKSPFLRLGGAGDIDIAGGSINYLAKATVVGTTTGQEGKELASLRGVTIPVRVTGPFESLSYALDPGAAVTEAAKAKVDEKVQQVQQKAQEKVQEKVGEQLKGLFGGR
jgi:AsmA protein